jgi:Domain of unknown function (DUF4288)
MPDDPDQLDVGWWVVRMIVDITVAGELSSCEDRFVLIRATSGEEARAKGEHVAQGYGDTYLNGDDETVTWKVRGISDVFGVVDTDLMDGSEVYSSFIDPAMANVLMTPRLSPLASWEAANPGKDSGEATVQEVVDHWDATNGDGPAS